MNQEIKDTLRHLTETADELEKFSSPECTIEAPTPDGFFRAQQIRRLVRCVEDLHSENAKLKAENATLRENIRIMGEAMDRGCGF